MSIFSQLLALTWPALQRRPRCAWATTVRILQQDLHELGYSGRSGNAIRGDGDFESETRHAVEAFQRVHH
jgi:peptidoglycan hydrolase-like protein with peptidoglycan-binding domain